MSDERIHLRTLGAAALQRVADDGSTTTLLDSSKLLALLSGANNPMPRQPVQIGQPEIFPNRMGQHQALELAVFREQADAGVDGVLRRTNGE